MPGRPRRHARNPRGAVPGNVVKRGSISGHRSKDKRVRQEADREADGRRKAALEQVAKQRAALDARMRYEAANPAVGRVDGAEWRASQPVPPPEPIEPARDAEEQERRERRRARMVLPPEDAEGDGSWTMGQARSMLRQGYHLYRVQQVTGWGAKCFDDMPVDQDGFGLP